MDVYSQDGSFLEDESVKVADALLTFSDSLQVDTMHIDRQMQNESIVLKSDRYPNPTKAVIYSAIFPGLGQIYNKKYWKLPIVYGGFIGCAYAIMWNNKTYKGYRDAYWDILDDDLSTNSWMKYGTSEENLEPILKRRRDYFRRYRDLSCIIAVGLYAVCMIDSYVDAQLFEFDISEDLSMRVDPVLFNQTAYNNRSVGFQCSFSF